MQSANSPSTAQAHDSNSSFPLIHFGKLAQTWFGKRMSDARAGILGHNAADTSDAGGDWIRTTEAVDAASNAADDSVAAYWCVMSLMVTLFAPVMLLMGICSFQQWVFVKKVVQRCSSNSCPPSEPRAALEARQHCAEQPDTFSTALYRPYILITLAFSSRRVAIVCRRAKCFWSFCCCTICSWQRRKEGYRFLLARELEQNHAWQFHMQSLRTGPPMNELWALLFVAPVQAPIALSVKPF